MERNNIIMEKLTTNELVAIIEKIINKALNDGKEKSIGISTDYITRKEASEMLSVSFPTLRSWHKAKLLIAYKIGTRVFYKINEVHQAMKQVYYE